MTISDIITLVSLIIAIVAIINEKNRGHLLLKFNITDNILLLVGFILVNYFVFYESFYSRQIYLHDLYFQNCGLRNPKNWSYFISIAILLFILYKILNSFFSFQRKEELLKFYYRQIENNETSFLLDLIDQYHKKDIILYIHKSKNFLLNSRSSWREIRPNISNIEKLIIWKNNVIRLIFPLSWFNRESYAFSILYSILNNPAFIQQASNLRPYLFADIISTFSEAKRRNFPSDLCNSFLTEIINHKNFWLKKELKQSESFDSGQPAYFFDENKILGGLLKDLSVAEVNQVWQPFGNIAVNEIKEERQNGLQSKLFQEFRGKDFLWEYRSFIAIKFFKILITEAITRKYRGSHFWLYYYKSITNAILETFDQYHPLGTNITTTNYHQLIEIMTDNLFLWLDISNKTEDNGFYHSIIDCLGSMTHLICNSPHFSEETQKSYVKRILRAYCNLENNSQTENIRTQLGTKLLHPSTLTNNEDNYYYQGFLIKNLQYLSS